MLRSAISARDRRVSFFVCVCVLMTFEQSLPFSSSKSYPVSGYDRAYLAGSRPGTFPPDHSRPHRDPTVFILRRANLLHVTTVH